MEKSSTFNKLDWLVSIGIPSVVFALYASHKGVSLPSLNLLILGVPLGVVLVAAHIGTLALVRKAGLQSEVLLQTALRIAVSAGIAVGYGALLF